MRSRRGLDSGGSWADVLFRGIAFGVVGFCSFYFAISLRDDAPPAIVLKVEAANPTVQPGGILRIRYIVRRLKSCSFKVDRTIFDAGKGRWALQDVDWGSAPGGQLGDLEYEAPVEVPTGVAYGSATYVAQTSFICNFTQRWFGPILSPPTTVPFNIVGPPLPIYIPPSR